MEDRVILVISQTWFQVIMAVANMLMFFIVTTLVSVVASWFSAIQFSQFVTSGVGLLMATPRWTRHKSDGVSLLYVVTSAVIWASSHISILLQKVDSNGAVMDSIGTGTSSLNPLEYQYKTTSQCSELLGNSLAWYNCTDIADPRRFHIGTSPVKTADPRFDSQTHQWKAVLNTTANEEVVIASAPDFSKLFNKTEALSISASHLTTARWDLGGYITETPNVTSPVMNSTGMEYFLATTAQWQPTFNNPNQNTSALLSAIQATASYHGYIIYYNIEVNNTRFGTHGSSCSATTYGSVFDKYKDAIKNPKVKPVTGATGTGLTGSLYDLEWTATSSGYKITVVSMSESWQGPGCCQYLVCDVYAYEAQVRFVVAKTNSKDYEDRKYDGRYKSPTIQNTLLTREDSYNRAISFCNMDTYHLANTEGEVKRRCDSQKFFSSLEQYHGLSDSIFTSSDPVNITFQGQNIRLREGFRIRISGVSVLAAIAALALVCTVPRFFMSRFMPYTSHALEIVAATTAGSDNKRYACLQTLPDIDVTLDGDRMSGYTLVVNNGEVCTLHRGSVEPLPAPGMGQAYQQKSTASLGTRGSLAT